MRRAHDLTCGSNIGIGMPAGATVT